MLDTDESERQSDKAGKCLPGSSLRACDADSFLQMENYEGDANNVYILVRVFDVRERHVGLRWFPEPRRRENLKFKGPKEGYYEVTTKNIYV